MEYIYNNFIHQTVLYEYIFVKISYENMHKLWNFFRNKLDIFELTKNLNNQNKNENNWFINDVFPVCGACCIQYE